MSDDIWGSQGHITQSCEVTEVKCKFCGSTNTVKYGVRDQVQQYMCNDCGRKFTEKDTLEGKQTPVEEMGAALSMYYDGLSLSAISRQLEGIYHDFVNPSTIYRWIMEYSQMAILLLDIYKARVSVTESESGHLAGRGASLSACGSPRPLRVVFAPPGPCP